MTRFGVMKHLKLLEEAGLVVTRRRGRDKLHFLNPVPIRLVHDRWVSKYAEPWVAGLSDLKETLEADGKGVRDLHPHHAERLWEAITDPDIRAKYQFGAVVYVGLAARVADQRRLTKPTASSARAPCSRPTRPAGWSTPWSRCGATT